MDFSVFVPYDLLPWQWAAWLTFGLCMGLLKAGFAGISVVLVPVIALIFGARESTGINLPLYCFGDLLAVLYYHRHAEWKYILKLLPWTLAGFAIAILADRVVPVQNFKYLMGGCILAALAVMVWTDLRGKDRPPPTAWWFSALFGMAGGFAASIGSIGGPILSVFLLSMKLPKNSFVGTAAWYFLIINYLRFPIQIFLWKNITVQTILSSLPLFPMVFAGGVLGVLLIKKISERLFRKIIMTLIMLSTVLLFI
jgi:hypothetical protein